MSKEIGATNRHFFFDFQDEYDYFGEFLVNKFVKGYWTALFILCMYWGFFLFAQHIFGDGNTYHNANLRHSREGAVHSLDAARYDNVHSWARLHRTANMIRDLVLLLLSVLIINTLARGGTRSVMILTWIYLGAAIFWSIFEMLYEHHIARLAYSTVFYGIAITIGGIAFKNGFDEFD
ncbi:hypothetical protein [Parasitella parasitica]|uniref:Uncharacterized protein n=1 Tax=Parasitella parasitica TaxID=35722 RepID=A0A0B7NF23_9FUNG|nr:hypothetical protein [Parasitella parasitica]